jgi:hypothetical protein
MEWCESGKRPKYGAISWILRVKRSPRRPGYGR